MPASERLVAFVSSCVVLAVSDGAGRVVTVPTAVSADEPHIACFTVNFKMVPGAMLAVESVSTINRLSLHETTTVLSAGLLVTVTAAVLVLKRDPLISKRFIGAAAIIVVDAAVTDG